MLSRHGIPIDIAICPVLDKRYSLWLELQQQCETYGIKVTPLIAGDGHILKKHAYDHIDINYEPPLYKESIQYATFHTKNSLNAWLCHRQVIAYGLNNQADSILFIEDDAQITPDFDEILMQCRDFFLQNEWDAIYLGWFSKGHLRDIGHKYVRRFNGGGGTHGVVLKRNILERLITFYPIGPFDWILGTYIHPQYKCYAIYPAVIIQRDGYSNLEGSEMIKPTRDHE